MVTVLSKIYIFTGKKISFCSLPPAAGTGGPSSGSADLTSCQLIKRFYLTPPDSSDTLSPKMKNCSWKLYLLFYSNKQFVALSQLLRTLPITCYNKIILFSRYLCYFFPFFFSSSNRWIYLTPTASSEP